MDVFIRKKPKNSCEQKTLKAFCIAEIPLQFVKKISSGAIKELASANILTLEQLHAAGKEIIREKISNRRLLQEIFDLKQQTQKMVSLAKHRNILLFEKRASHNNIKIRPDQRAEIIGIIIFAKILKEPLEVLSLVLNKFYPTKFREQALLKKIGDITKKTIRMAS